MFLRFKVNKSQDKLLVLPTGMKWVVIFAVFFNIVSIPVIWLITHKLEKPQLIFPLIFFWLLMSAILCTIEFLDKRKGPWLVCDISQGYIELCRQGLTIHLDDVKSFCITPASDGEDYSFDISLISGTEAKKVELVRSIDIGQLKKIGKALSDFTGKMSFYG